MTNHANESRSDMNHDTMIVATITTCARCGYASLAEEAHVCAPNPSRRAYDDRRLSALAAQLSSAFRAPGRPRRRRRMLRLRSIMERLYSRR
jgi:hypothetical protein